MSLVQTLILSVLVLTQAPHETPTQQRPVPRGLQQLDAEVNDLLQSLGNWEDQLGIVNDAINSIWEQNEWNTEADQYARQSALNMSQIPPWRFQDRLNAFYDIVDQRYDLTDDQMDKVRSMVMREGMTMSLKYAPVVLRQSKEALTTRLDGRPFSAEQVARWVNESEFLIDPWKNDIARIQKQFGKILTPEQQTIYARDLKSMNKRMNHMLEARQRWKQGQWTPSEWGLENDPIHRDAAQSDPGMPAIASSAQAYDESTWLAYVRAFIAHYQLDQAQQNACMAILKDLEQQAAHYRNSKKLELEALTVAQRRHHALLEPVRALFNELKQRLRMIPSEQQRLSAGHQSPRRAAQRHQPGVAPTHPSTVE